MEEGSVRRKEGSEGSMKEGKSDMKRMLKGGKGKRGSKNGTEVRARWTRNKEEDAGGEEGGVCGEGDGKGKKQNKGS